MLLRKTSKEIDRVVVFNISRKLKVRKYRPKAYNMWTLMSNQQKTLENQGLEEMPDTTTGEILGDGGTVVKAVKIGGNRLLEKIRKLFNSCLRQGESPTRWHNALTILVHKKGD